MTRTQTKLLKVVKGNLFFFIYSAVAFFIFYLIFKLRIVTDIQAHIEILQIYLERDSFPNPPLYYASIYVLNFLFFAPDYIFPTILVLSVSSIFKYYIVRRYLAGTDLQRNNFFVDVFTFSLMFFSPIFLYSVDGSTMYLGKFTSTIWHNSTTIFVFPFSIWLFVVSLQYLERPDKFTVIKLLLISAIVVLSKPSFLFPFILVFPLFALLKFGLPSKYFLFAVILGAFIFLALIFQKNIIYQNSAELDKVFYKGEPSKVIVAPFAVWLHWAINPFLNIITSFLFLFTVIILKFQTFKKDYEFRYVLVLFLAALTIFFTLAESGPRFYHGNFYWQIPISLMVLNMVILKKIIQPYTNRKINMQLIITISNRDKVIFICFIMHFLCGLLYSLRLLLAENYN